MRSVTSFSGRLRDSERALMVEMLDSVGWVIAGTNGAAAEMGVARTTLLARMKRLGISKRERFGIGAEPRTHFLTLRSRILAAGVTLARSCFSR